MSSSGPTGLHHCSTDSSSPVTLASSGEERAAAIQTALEHLPIEQREALVLRIWGGLSIAETARVLAANPNTVAGRCRQALVSLAALLPEECHERV